MIQSFLTFDFTDRTLKCKGILKPLRSTLLWFVFQFSPDYNFEKCITFGIGTVRSESVFYRYRQLVFCRCSTMLLLYVDIGLAVFTGIVVRKGQWSHQEVKLLKSNMKGFLEV